MLRIGFTIILNGVHHLMHNNYAKYLLTECLDYWIIVEGASLSNGSTAWCNNMPSDYTDNGKSKDGTIKYIKDLQSKYTNLIYVSHDGFYDSKDVQVNLAINEIKKITNSCYLWEIDADEQWTKDDMIYSENELLNGGGKCGVFSCNLYIAKHLIIRGTWGEHDYRRLWNWQGELFEKHEPPTLTNNLPIIPMSKRFNHYSYYFENDVKFKSQWYGNHQDVYDNWSKIIYLDRDKFPLHIGNFMNQCKNYDSYIYYL